MIATHDEGVVAGLVSRRALRNRRRWSTVLVAMKVLASVLVGIVLVSCGTPTPSPSPSAASFSIQGSPPPPAARIGLHLVNGTTLTVTLVVNERTVWTAPPSGASMVDAVDLPSGPWAVQVQSPTGRVLAKLHATAIETDSSTFDIVDLSCGRLILWAGGPVPDAPVVPSPFAPSDCAR